MTGIKIMSKASENQELIRIERERLLRREISHHEYHLWLGELIGITKNYLPDAATEKAVKACSDDNLNDIPLKLWDDLHGSVRILCAGKILIWSLSDTVCVLKTLACELYRKEKRPL